MERFEPDMTAGQRLIDMVDVGVFAVDRALCVRSWNAFMVAHSGLGRQAAIGRSIFDLFSDLPRGWLEKKFERVFALGAPSFTSWEQRPWLFRIPHNRPITGGVDCMQQDTRFIPLKDEHGEAVLVLVCVFDVTDAALLHRRLAETVSALEAERSEQQTLIARLAEAQEQLIQSEKLAAIGQLAAGVAHEINNPVGFVMSNFGALERYIERAFALIAAYDRQLDQLPPAVQADMAQMKADIDYDFMADDARSLVAESRDGLERVKRIVSDLRDFSRVGETEWQWASLHNCLDSTLNVVMNEIKYKAQVVKDYGDLPQIECMPFQLNQVFLNLLVNAAHAIDGQGAITLRTRLEGDSVVVQFSDTGCGMPPEVVKRIFDPFFTTKPVGKGTGLGLSVTHSIVGRHRGSIAVDSTPGQGTTFTLRLPLRQTSA
ncbi:Sensor protein [Methyloversatilis universalis FAM5]|uniref:histidine kinase n=1 Tax=Methyloversatilis universalis (strain ATCC BAA-1314 / DSM 25237 / JCM 13912 / CCUG 52030 / FAM5) TaxID=1000565 RepID=F5R7C4_METUF|nr:ATP-binding protein [Methyloversatilis universalis]EGK73427.1 Sensor protein [Methyloversatilis universalis FAM5]